MLQWLHILQVFSGTLQHQREHRLVSARRRQLHARDLQVHTMLEGQVATKRHLCLHCENEDCCDQTSRRVETDPRPAETCGENQRTRTVLKAEAKIVRVLAAQHRDVMIFDHQRCDGFGPVFAICAKTCQSIRKALYGTCATYRLA